MFGARPTVLDIGAIHAIIMDARLDSIVGHAMQKFSHIRKTL